MLTFQLVSRFQILELKSLDTLIIDTTCHCRLLNHSQISELTGPILYCLGLFYDKTQAQHNVFKFDELWLALKYLN